MVKPTDAVINNPTQLGTNPGLSANLSVGAQYGLGAHLALLDAATPQVLPPVIPIVLHVPSMFNELEGVPELLKTLMERHAREITGIDPSYTLESESITSGHDGQPLEIPTHSRRNAQNPQFVFPEVLGNLVWNMMRLWITWISDPDTQSSRLSQLGNVDTNQPMLASSYAMDMLFIQPGRTLRPEDMVDAWIFTNLWPKETSAAGYQRTIGEVTRPERSIPFAGVYQHNTNTRHVGRSVMEVLGMHRVNFDIATPVMSQISDRIADLGVQEETARAVRDFVEIA